MSPIPIAPQQGTAQDLQAYQVFRARIQALYNAGGTIARDDVGSALAELDVALGPAT